MITEEQRKERRNYLGSSDAAGVLGRSSYDTPLSIWCEKTGQYIKPEVESEAAELGKEFEDYVAKRFARKTGKVILPSDHTFFHPDYAFLGANLDRLIEGEDAILEAKTCGERKAKDWANGETPQEYIIQVYHQLMVTGKKKAYLAVLIGNRDFQWREIPRNEKAIDDLLKIEVKFWTEFVDTLIMPAQIMSQDSEVLLGLFPEAIEGKSIELSDQANIYVEQLTAAKQDLRSVENLIEITENNLKKLLGDAESGQTSRYKVFWKNSKWSGLDGKSLKEAYPDIHSQFYRSKQIRRFDYKSIVEEK